MLPAELAASHEMLDRFRREARAVAAVNHPAIVTIYSVEEADGVHFLTMELIEGRSLDHLLPASGLDAERICDFLPNRENVELLVEFRALDDAVPEGIAAPDVFHQLSSLVGCRPGTT